MLASLPTIVISVIGIIILLVLGGLIVVSRWRVAGPNEAFIITGSKVKEIRTEQGGISQDLSGQKVVRSSSCHSSSGCTSWTSPAVGSRSKSGVRSQARA